MFTILKYPEKLALFIYRLKIKMGSSYINKNIIIIKYLPVLLNPCILFAHLIGYYEKTFADHHFSVLVLKCRVGRTRVGKNRIFPIDLHDVLME